MDGLKERIEALGERAKSQAGKYDSLGEHRKALYQRGRISVCLDILLMIKTEKEKDSGN